MAKRCVIYHVGGRGVTYTPDEYILMRNALAIFNKGWSRPTNFLAASMWKQKRTPFCVLAEGEHGIITRAEQDALHWFFRGFMAGCGIKGVMDETIFTGRSS